ncbi:MAG: ABC transporter ATP-binding protein, partial [candidate division WOR-3 bacterium]
MPLLSVENLRVYFDTDFGVVKAVDGITYHIEENEIVGLVGESGCGKSVSQLATLQLIPSPPGRIVEGKIFFEGKNILEFPPAGAEMCKIRGRKISMIFQEPMTSLNPSLTVGKQVMEMMILHLNMKESEARKKAVELLKLVGIPDPERRIDDYPHQFSGGMRQRVMIAMAISCNPKIIIADEPTTAVDVTVQAQLLELLTDVVKRHRSSLILVTHNLGVIARYAHRVYVMYAGRIIESAPCKEIFGNPLHPYTKALLRSVPRIDEPPGKILEPID